jgi:hypothetical protein
LGPDRITEDSVLELTCSAVATQMRFAATPDFTTADWIPYADDYALDVGAGSGERVVYGQFRNYWTQSAVLTDWYIQIGQPLEISFLAPPDSAIVRGGVDLLTRGTARAAADTPEIDRVEVYVPSADVWEEATGTTDWSHLLAVPRFGADKWLDLRARVITAAGDAEPDTASALVSVLVTQLVVTIGSPAPDAEISAGALTTIGGTAVPAADGAAPDSVVVVAGDDRLVAPGAEVWSVEWTSPAVTAATPVTITATLHAGEESVSESIDVTVVPAGRR